MTIKMEWLLAGRVSFSRMIGNLTAEDIEAWDEQALAFVDQIDHDCNFAVVDQTKLKLVENMPKLLAMQINRYPKARQITYFVTYGVPNNVIRTATNLMGSVSRIPTRAFAKQDEALAFIYSLDPTLPDLKPLIEAVWEDDV